MAKEHSEDRQHRSFRRSYREDYVRELEVPGVGRHIAEAFRMIFADWRVFLPLWGLGVGLTLLLAVGSKEVVVTFGVLIFLMIWLVTIFLLRQKMVGNKVGLRDALYNAMTPLISTLVVFVVIAVQSVPIFILIIAYAAAVETNFLAMPFYALMFFGFAAVMVLLSGYLLSSSLMALVAASAPGLYPLAALRTASELMAGRRMKFVLRLVALLLMLAVIWVAVVALLNWIEAGTGRSGWVETVGVAVLACFTEIYATAYLYIYYRWVLES